jgi:hypothetical protein
MSTENDYQRCLQKLATAPPKGKAALVPLSLAGNGGGAPPRLQPQCTLHDEMRWAREFFLLG